MNKHVKGWDKANYDDSKWVKARVIGTGVTKA
jgi:hypothetical protein